ncbi:MAG: DUF2927 domain-containing protein [Rhodospirillaceae bacterium]|jgi:hypothetical protein|nr:DUF2927 domain-containing protein [Rhodospirillaceae bacterium]
MFRLIFILGLVLGSVQLVAQSVSLAVAQAGEKPNARQLTAFFEDVVFGSEYGNKGSTVIQKWTGPIRIQVSAMSGDMVSKAGGGKELKLANRRPSQHEVAPIRKHLGALLKLSGLKAEDAKKAGKKPNLFIRFVPRLAMHAKFLVPSAPPKLLKKLAAPGVCYFLTAQTQGRIVWGIIVVNNQLSEPEMNACLLEEMTQVLGLPNDSDLVQPSVFNNKTQPIALNRTDQILIRTLYDKRLVPGTDRGRAMAAAAKVIVELDRMTKN